MTPEAALLGYVDRLLAETTAPVVLGLGIATLDALRTGRRV